MKYVCIKYIVNYVIAKFVVF